MQIKYQLDLDDILEFNKYHFDHSPHMRHAQQMYRLLLGFNFLFILIVAGVLLNNPQYWVLIWILLIFLLIFFPRSAYEKRQMNSVKKLYSEGKNKQLFGIHNLELDEQFLKESSGFRRQEVSYSVVEKLVVTNDYFFIYFNAVIAFVVPRKKIIEGNDQEFIDLLKTKVDSSFVLDHQQQLKS